MTGYEPGEGIQLASSLADMESSCHGWRWASSVGGREGGGGGLRVKGASGGREGGETTVLLWPDQGQQPGESSLRPSIKRFKDHQASIHGHCPAASPLLLSTETLVSSILPAETKDQTKGKKNIHGTVPTLQNKAEHRTAYILL